MAASPIGIVVYDESGQAVMVNDAAPAIVGATREQVMQQNVFEIESWRRTGLLALAEQALTETKLTRKELHLTSTFGKEVWLDTRFVPFEWEGRTFLLLVFDDVSERVLLANALEASQHDLEELVAVRTQALRESEAKYRSLYNNAQAGIYRTHVDGRFLDLNDKMAAMFGLSKEAVLQKSAPEFWADVADREAFVRALQENGMVNNFEGRFQTPSGVRTFLLAGTLDVDTGVIEGTAVDITARLKAQAALQQSEQRFRSFFETDLIGMAVTSLEKGWVHVNDRLCDILGYPRVELIQKTWVDVTHPDDIQQDVTYFNTLLDGTANGYEMDKRFIRKDGQIIHAHIVVRTMRSSDGRLDHFLALVDDITERKQAELALAQNARELFRSNQDLEQFAYIASHDLQEPLRMVNSFLQLLQRRYGEQLDQDAHDYINFAVDGAQRMQKMINELLQYSRVGTRGRDPEPTDSGDVLTQVLDNLEIQLHDTEATVTHDPLPVVMADRNQLTQLLQNLLSNGLKFHKPGERPHIHVAAAAQDGMWQFAVADNGIGVEPHYADQVFELFRRLHTQEEYPGTGLGLAICKRIVERHNGRIWLDATPGEGTTVYFMLPKPEG